MRRFPQTNPAKVLRARCCLHRVSKKLFWITLWLASNYRRRLMSTECRPQMPCKFSPAFSDTTQFPPHKFHYAPHNLWLPEHNGIVELFWRRQFFVSHDRIYFYCRLETNQQFTIRRKTICYGRRKILKFRFVTIERCLKRPLQLHVVIFHT